MNKTFRLHRQHDMDLIALYRSEDFNFTKELKKALIAYANDLPYTPPPFEDTLTAGYVGTSITFHISLSPTDEKQKRVLDLLDDIRYGYGNSFVKALFRSYLPVLPLSAFSKNNGIVTSRQGTVMPRLSRPASVIQPETEVVAPTPIKQESDPGLTRLVPMVDASSDHFIVTDPRSSLSILQEMGREMGYETIKVADIGSSKPSAIAEPEEIISALEANPTTTSPDLEDQSAEEEVPDFDMSNFMAGLGNLAHSR